MSFIKELDRLHYLLITTIVVLGITLAYNVLNSNKPVPFKPDYDFVKERFIADSLALVEEYDQAIAHYQKLDIAYPNRINLTAIKAIISLKKAKKTEKPSQKDALNPTPAVTMISREKDEKKTPTKAILKENLKKEQITSSPSDSSSKGILKITNFDGAEINYIGQIENNQANGYGFAVFAKKGFYEGQWANNMRNGEGIYYWQNGDIYQGQYVDGFRTGYGIYTFESGDIYKGYWKDNLRQGKGALYSKRKKLLFEGEWVKDEPVKKRKNKKKK